MADSKPSNIRIDGTITGRLDPNLDPCTGKIRPWDLTPRFKTPANIPNIQRLPDGSLISFDLRGVASFVGCYETLERRVLQSLKEEQGYEEDNTTRGSSSE